MSAVENFLQIDIHQAKQMMAQGGVTIVDVRSPDAYHAGHLHGAVLVTDETIDKFLADTDKAKPLICYCYHGFSSQSACQFFKQSGFEKVYSVEGGFEAWKTVYPFINK